MKLMTKSIEKELAKRPFGSTDGKSDVKAVVKYFGGSAATWLVLEGEKEGNDWCFYGAVTLDGYYWEYGYFMLSELEGLRFPPFGLGVERDLYFNRSISDEIGRSVVYS